MDFKTRLLETIKTLLTSKKVLTAIVGLIVGALAKRGIILSPDDITLVIVVFGALLGAQGAQDWGKSAAIIQAVNPPPPTQTQNVNVDSQPVQDLPRTTSRFS